jgi:hypothetical protein
MLAGLAKNVVQVLVVKNRYSQNHRLPGSVYFSLEFLSIVLYAGRSDKAARAKDNIWESL